MYISFNASAVVANNSLNRTDRKLQDSLARLSSGLKIINPKDNPSGLAMAKRMNAQIAGIEQANNNAGDGISIIEIADGTMSEIADMLQRLNELAVKAANGTYTDDDRDLIDKEVQQLKTEITRISKETSYNGQRLMDGSFDLKGYTSNVEVKVSYYSDSVVYGDYELTALNVTYNADGTIATATGGAVDKVATDGSHTAVQNLNTEFSGNTVTISNTEGWELKLELNKNATGLAGTTIDLTGIGSMDMQIGANEGQQLPIRIPKISLENLQIKNLDVKTQDHASDALAQINYAIKFVSAARANLGAYQNRLEHTTKSLDITGENMTGAYSRIMDVDMAEEMTEYSTLNILSQASTSMLSQANDRPAQILQLLQ